MNHRLVIIGSLHENIELVKRAKKRGYYTIVCDGYKDGPAKLIADKSYDIDVRDTKSIAEICQKEKADGIIGSFSDLVFEQITKIAYSANIKWYATPDMLKYYRDKTEQKKLLKEIGVSVPKYTLIREKPSLESIADFSFPIVVKPIHGWGSKDITVLNNKNEFDVFFDKKSDLKYEEFEIEEYIDAYEYNAISWIKDGEVNILGIADRQRNPRKNNKIQILTRVIYPSVHYDELKSKVYNVLQKFIEHTGQKYGPISMQFFYKDNEVVVCEIAGRVLAHEYKLINYCGGSDIVDLLLDYPYNNSMPVEMVKTDSVSCGIYFMCEENSFINDSTKARKAIENEYVKDALWFCEDGNIFDDSYPYYLRCYLKAETREALDEVSEDMFNQMQVLDREGNNVLIKIITENREEIK